MAQMASWQLGPALAEEGGIVGGAGDAFQPMASWQMAAVLAWYFGFKLFIRFGPFVNDATVADPKKGWARETFVAALGHNVTISVVWALAVAHALQRGPEPVPSDGLVAWMLAPWESWEQMPFERLCFAMNIAEMVTDSLLYSGYAGFGSSYWAHHITTFLSASAFFICDRVPVGLAVCFGSWMEGGSTALNWCNLYPSPTAFRMRALVYASSRVICTLLLLFATKMAIFNPESIAVSPLMPLWILIAVNWSWVITIVKAQWRVEMSGCADVQRSTRIY